MRCSRGLWLMALSFGVSAVALPVSTAHAQAAEPNTDANAGLGLEEVLVTAQRREQRLQDVPVAVSVVTGDSLERSNLRTLEDIGTRLPNVKITSGPLVDQINIRGVGSGQNSGFEQSVATFVDGIYRSRSRSTRAALFDVERVEVLKGPQTTFFGANAIAGAINITTRVPDGKFAVNGSALYGEDDEYNVEAGATLPVSDTLSVRLAGRFSGMNGYVENDTLGEGPHDRSSLQRLAVRWEPGDSFSSTLRLDNGRSRTRNAFNFGLVGCPPPAPFVIGPTNTCGRYLALGGDSTDGDLDYRSESNDNFANYDFYEGAWTNSLDLDGATLTAITGYFNHEYDEHIQTVPMPVAGTVNGYDGLPVYVSEDYHQFSQELRYQSRGGGAFEYMFGAYYSRSKLDNSNVVGFFFLPFGAFTPFTSPTDGVTGRPQLLEEDETQSVFAAATIRPLEDLRVNLGLRYSRIHKEAVRDTSLGTSINAEPSTYVRYPLSVQAIFSQILGADLGQFAEPTRTDSKLMPSVGLQYELTPDVMAYASYSLGFKAGGYSAASLAESYGPETVDAYEVGLKSTLWDRRLTLNTAVFLSDYKDLQESTIVFAPSGTIISLIRNAAESRAKGVEVGANLRVTRSFSVNADLAYLDSIYTSYPAGACTAVGNLSPNCIQDLSGKRRPYAPEFSGTLSASLLMPVGNYEARIEPSMYFSSKFFESATADPVLEQAGYGKVDLRLALGPAGGPWEIALVGKNLTDKATAGFRQPVTLAPGTVLTLLDQPRSVALQFSYR